MSEANFAQKMAIKNYGSNSKEHTIACLDNGHQDPSLHPIGLAMCDHSQYQVNMINWSIVYTSPMRRNLETTIHTFKNHPNKDNIKFVILPIVREVIQDYDDIVVDYDTEIMQRYKTGSPENHGLVFDFSRFYLYGIP